MKNSSVLILAWVCLQLGSLKASELPFASINTCYQSLVGSPTESLTFPILTASGGTEISFYVSYPNGLYDYSHFVANPAGGDPGTGTVHYPGLTPFVLYDGFDASLQGYVVSQPGSQPVPGGYPIVVEGFTPEIHINDLNGDGCYEYGEPIELTLDDIPGFHGCIEWKVDGVTTNIGITSSNGYESTTLTRSSPCSRFITCEQITVEAVIYPYSDCTSDAICPPITITKTIEACCPGMCPVVTQPWQGLPCDVIFSSMAPNPGFPGPVTVTLDQLPSDGSIDLLNVVDLNSGLSVYSVTNLTYMGTSLTHVIDMSAQVPGMYVVSVWDEGTPCSETLIIH